MSRVVLGCMFHANLGDIASSNLLSPGMHGVILVWSYVHATGRRSSMQCLYERHDVLDTYSCMCQDKWTTAVAAAPWHVSEQHVLLWAICLDTHVKGIMRSKTSEACHRMATACESTAQHAQTKLVYALLLDTMCSTQLVLCVGTDAAVFCHDAISLA